MPGAARVLALGLLPVAIAAGAWRLDRDRPAWGTRAHPAALSGSAPGALPRLVLGVHYPWYGTPSGPAGRWRHWNHARLAMPGGRAPSLHGWAKLAWTIPGMTAAPPGGRVLGFHDPAREVAPGRLDLGASHYPEAGPYDSRDPARIRAQLRAARAAGLDGFAVSWWGRESEESLALADLFREARGTGLVLAPYYETGELWRRGATGVAADLLALLDRHGREPAWLRVGGRPVVFLYAAHRLTPTAWDAVLARLAARGRRLFLVAEAPRPEWLAARPDWLARFDALHVYTPAVFLAGGRDLAATYRALADLAQRSGRPFVPAVSPGFDDRSVRAPGTVVPRMGGATYTLTWQAALGTDPPWILVSTWNEWHEGSEIEPSVEHGTRYVEATRAWAERYRTGG